MVMYQYPIQAPKRKYSVIRQSQMHTGNCSLYAEYLQTGQWSQNEYANHVMPLVSFTEYADAVEFRKNVYNKLMDEK